VKRFALCYRILSVLSVCPVCNVSVAYCGDTVGCIKMKLDMQVGPGPGHVVLDGDPTPPPKGQNPPPSIFCCGQTTGWIKMPHGTKVASAQVTLCYMGNQLRTPPKRGAALTFRSIFIIVAKRLDGQDATWY